jgi:uncharacterized protein YuzE
MDENAAGINGLLEANKDLEERLRTSGIRVGYDREHDMLLITIGEPQEAITEEVSKGLYVRVDPETEKIVGMTITSFEKGFLGEHPDFRRHFDTVFGAPRMIETWEVVPRTKASEQASIALRALVPA